MKGGLVFVFETRLTLGQRERECEWCTHLRTPRRIDEDVLIVNDNKVVPRFPADLPMDAEPDDVHVEQAIWTGRTEVDVVKDVEDFVLIDFPFIGIELDADCIVTESVSGITIEPLDARPIRTGLILR